MQFMSSPTYNHSIEYYARIVSNGIIVLDQIHPADRAVAAQVQAQIKEIMIPIFFSAIELEKGALESDPDQCSKPLDDIGMYFASNAIKAIFALENNPYADQFKHIIPNWEAEMLVYISTNVRTAMHLERIEFAKNNPDNVSAKDYANKFGV